MNQSPRYCKRCGGRYYVPDSLRVTALTFNCYSCNQEDLDFYHRRFPNLSGSDWSGQSNGDLRNDYRPKIEIWSIESTGKPYMICSFKTGSKSNILDVRNEVFRITGISLKDHRLYHYNRNLSTDRSQIKGNLLSDWEPIHKYYINVDKFIMVVELKAKIKIMSIKNLEEICSFEIDKSSKIRHVKEMVAKEIDIPPEDQRLYRYPEYCRMFKADWSKEEYDSGFVAIDQRNQKVLPLNDFDKIKYTFGVTNKYIVCVERNIGIADEKTLRICHDRGISVIDMIPIMTINNHGPHMEILTVEAVPEGCSISNLKSILKLRTGLSVKEQILTDGQERVLDDSYDILSSTEQCSKYWERMYLTLLSGGDHETQRICDRHNINCISTFRLNFLTKTVELKFQKFRLISDVKMHIQKEFNIRVGDQVLIYKGKELTDNQITRNVFLENKLNTLKDVSLNLVIDKKPFQVRISPEIPSMSRFDISINDSDSIEELKQKIQAKTSIPLQNIQLIDNTTHEILCDTKIVEDYMFLDKSVITLQQKLFIRLYFEKDNRVEERVEILTENEQRSRLDLSEEIRKSFLPRQMSVNEIKGEFTFGPTINRIYEIDFRIKKTRKCLIM